MNTFVKKILKTAIPVTIGSIILIGSFWVADRLEPSYGLLSCEDNSLSDSTYLTLLGIVAAIGILYQLTIAKQLRDKIKMNKLLESIIEIISFMGCFVVVMICIALIQRNEISIGDFLSIGVALGSVYTVSRLLFGKLIK